MIGQTISHYKILEQLGGGGMGIVYKAEDTKLKRTVALKFLPADLTRDEESKERFSHEAQAASALDHPNICNIHEIDETEDGQIFICMAYYEGETLKKIIARGLLPVEEAVDTAIQIAQGLAKAHGQEIVHRDIKPANLMVTNDDVVKIVDFGLAKLAGRTKVTKAGTTVGTAAYMSPEQTQGQAVDHRTDIWSLGVVLYEMLTGHLPFKGDYEQAIVYSILNENPGSVTRLRPGIPMELAWIVDKALAKKTGERYQHVDEMLVDLKRVKREFETRDILKRTGAQVAVQKKKLRWLIPAVVVVGLAAVAVVLFLSDFATTEREIISERKMLAVLPFENLGPAEEEYFADGITEEITVRLASIQGLGVIARTSAIQYKNTQKTLQQIGEELGVDYILEGTVRWQHGAEAPSRVRVTPQLIKVSDATHLWANVYDQAMAEVFQVQSDIAEKVVNALDIALLEPERKSLAAKPTGNLEAYDYYLRGLDYANRSLAKEDLRIALQMYEKAVQLDPNFALAYARLSNVHAAMYWFFYDRTEARLARAKDAMDKAFQIRPDLPEAHSALGYYYYWGQLSYDRALEQFEIALSSQPNNSQLWAGIGFVQRRQGKFDESATNLKKATELDPRSAILAENLAETYSLIRNYPEAERYFDRAISLAPDWFGPYVSKTRLYVKWEGTTEKARAVLEEASEKVDPAKLISTSVTLDVFDGDYQAALDRLFLGPSDLIDNQFRYVPKSLLFAQIYGLMNEAKMEQAYYDSARSFLQNRVDERPEDARYHSSLGIVYAGLGRKDEAIREGKQAVELLPVSKEAWRGAVHLEDLAHIYVMVGEYDAAIDQLEFLLSVPSPISSSLLRLDPKWAPLRDNPRFQKLLTTAK